MSQGDMAAALEPFAQAEASLIHRFRGTGLGLPMARALMRLHGGELSLESELGAVTPVTGPFPRERVLGGNGRKGNGKRGRGRIGNGGNGNGGNGGGNGGGAPA